jgi:hypothetical protein
VKKTVKCGESLMEKLLRNEGMIMMMMMMMIMIMIMM